MKKIVFITGASSAIGRALACEFASGGFDLFLTGRRAAVLKKTVAELRKRFGIEIRYFAADLSDSASTEQLLAAVSGRDFEVLVNIPETEETSWYEAEPDERTSIQHRRIVSIVSLTNSILGRMIRLRAGRVLNVVPACDFAGLAAKPYSSFYRTSMLTFSSAIANELKPYGITVTVGCLGALETTSPFFEGKNSLRARKAIARTFYKETLDGRSFAVTEKRVTAYESVTRFKTNIHIQEKQI